MITIVIIIILIIMIVVMIVVIIMILLLLLLLIIIMINIILIMIIIMIKGGKAGEKGCPDAAEEFLGHWCPNPVEFMSFLAGKATYKYMIKHINN